MPPETSSGMKCLINMNISVSEARVQDASVSFSLSVPTLDVSTTSSKDLVDGICDQPAQLETPASGINDVVASSGHIVQRKRARLLSPELGSKDEVGTQWYDYIHDLTSLLGLIIPEFENHDVMFNTFLQIIAKDGIAGIRRIKNFILEDCEWYQPGTWICLKDTFLGRPRKCLLRHEECSRVRRSISLHPCVHLQKVPDSGLAVIFIGPQK
ncbi:hypothetical protein F4814DRAFT_428633 [Daldinia grandis]|nr:hypothetical protein F4814DRAFT_428633 [Daldinia grandis]